MDHAQPHMERYLTTKVDFSQQADGSPEHIRGDIAWHPAAVQKGIASTATFNLARKIGSFYGLSFQHYPVLTVAMNGLALISLGGFAQYLATDSSLVHPFALVWGMVGFGGMALVIGKASKYIHERRKQ